MEYDSMLKAELVAECEKRGLATDGLKPDLIGRLIESDNSASKNKPAISKVKKRVWNPMLFRYENK
jgi:hypothetical protein